MATPIAVVDAEGAVLQSTVPLLPETGRMFAQEIQTVSAPRGRRRANRCRGRAPARSGTAS